MKRPCSNCRIVFDLDSLTNREDLGLGCESLCERCEQEILAEALDDIREQEFYAEWGMRDAEGWK